MMHYPSRNLGTGLRSGVIYDCWKKTGGGGGLAGDDLSPETFATEIKFGNRRSSDEMWWDWSEEVQQAADDNASSKNLGKAARL